MDILELLSLRAGKAMSQSEIAEGIGRSKNEIFRMMVVLEERGYIERRDGDLFALLPRFGDLNAGRTRTARMIEVAQAHMERLSQQTNLSNHLWVLKDDKMQVAAIARASDSYSLALSEGVESPLLDTSAGACFVSHLSDTQDRLNALHRLGEYPDATRFAPFDDHIQTCARDGYCVMPSNETNDILEISAPLLVQNRDAPVAALTVPMIGGQSTSNNLSDIAEKLSATVQQISVRLGFLSIYQTA